MFKQNTLIAVLTVLLFQLASLQAGAQENSAVHSLKQTLSTDAYVNILKSLLNAETYSNPVSICANCHDGPDLVRYTKDLGPSMKMSNPANWIDPAAYVNMLAPYVTPETYTKWYDAWVKRYGGLVGLGEGAEKPAAE